MFKQTLLATVLSVGLVGAAAAAPINFTSDGGFSQVSIFDPGYCFGCSISGGGNVLDMSGSNNSTLTANDFGSGPLFTNLSDQLIGKLTWVNNASTRTDQNFNINYTLKLTFTAPNADVASQVFNLNIQQTNNPQGDIVSGLTISGLPATFNLLGVVVSNFKFSTIGNGSSIAGGVWKNPENGTAILSLTADFTAVQVPEPASLALLGAGLFGLGLVRRRRPSVA